MHVALRIVAAKWSPSGVPVVRPCKTMSAVSAELDALLRGCIVSRNALITGFRIIRGPNPDARVAVEHSTTEPMML